MSYVQLAARLGFAREVIKSILVINIPYVTEGECSFSMVKEFLKSPQQLLSVFISNILTKILRFSPYTINVNNHVCLSKKLKTFIELQYML